MGISAMATRCCLLIISARNLLFLHLLTMHLRVGPLWDMEWWLIGALQQIVKTRKTRNACDALWVLMFCLLVHEGEYWHNAGNASFRVESVTHGGTSWISSQPAILFLVDLPHYLQLHQSLQHALRLESGDSERSDDITPTLITNLTKIKTRGGDWKQVVEDHVLDSEDCSARLMSNFTISRSLAYNTFILAISSTETSILVMYRWVWPMWPNTFTFVAPHCSEVPGCPLDEWLER